MPLNTGRAGHVDEAIHGIIVRDPYRWLENGESTATLNWVADQQRHYDEYFTQFDDLNFLRTRVCEYLDVEIVDQPVKIGHRYFFRKRDKGREQANVYVHDTSTGKQRLLIDASTKGDFASVGIHRVSFDGAFLAYELRHGGSDKTSIHIIDVESGVEFPSRVHSGYTRGLAFVADQAGFYYCHENRDDSGDHAIRFHKFGDSSVDEKVFSRPRSVDSRLILTYDQVHLGAIYTHSKNGTPVAELSLASQNTPCDWSTVKSDIPLTYRPMLSNGHIFALTYEGSPNGMLVELDHDGCEARVVIPEQDQALRHIAIVGDHIVVTQLNGWGTAATLWTISGNCMGQLSIPVDGSIRILPSRGSQSLFCSYESFSEPVTIYEFHEAPGEVEIWNEPTIRHGRKTCLVEPAIVTSKDGTRVPLLAVARPEVKGGPKTATIMTGYGGFGTAVTPEYSVLVSIMLELGCVFVLARIRGGGEFGKSWHDAGMRCKRQNSFDDFIAVAEWLCATGVVTPERLGIFGGSNAGLLVGAALTQRPELFGAVVCIAPLLDMVRYEKFDHASRWRNEYGSVDNAEDFASLLAYSPYHHIQDNVDYPPTLFISGDMDDRCNPAHVRKMTAGLQQRASQTRPILVDYSPTRGHCPVLPLSVRIESLTRRIAFLCKALAVTFDWSGR